VSFEAKFGRNRLEHLERNEKFYKEKKNGRENSTGNGFSPFFVVVFFGYLLYNNKRFKAIYRLKSIFEEKQRG
jgi:hypothetical protein